MDGILAWLFVIVFECEILGAYVFSFILFAPSTIDSCNV